MLRQAPAWMGQNLIRLVEKMMLDGCLDENTKARYQFKSPLPQLPSHSLTALANQPLWVGDLQDHLHRRRGQVDRRRRQRPWLSSWEIDERQGNC